MPTRSADEEALLRAVWDAPNDDAPRLVYADWLDEHGNADRAEFIRVQCERTGADPTDARYSKLERREAALWKKHRVKWTRGLPPSTVFRRGFPITGTISLPIRSLHPLSLSGWDFAPAVHLGLHGSLSALDAVADWPGLDRVGALQLKGAKVTGHKLARFLASPRLRNLTALEFLQVFDLGEAGVRALVESAVWPRLTRLSFWYCGFDGSLMAALAGARPAPDLAELQVNEPRVRGRDVRAIAASAVLAPVRDLRLAHSLLGSSGVIALADSPYLGAVRRLDLGYIGRVSGRAVERLSHAPALANLCSLSIGVLSDPDALSALVDSPVMAQLRELGVVYARGARLSPRVGRKVRARFGPGAVIRPLG
jgi:uncharacterized protein (TIGR02996 family)